MKKRVRLMVAMVISSITILSGSEIDKGNGVNSFYLTPNAISTTTAGTQIANLNATFVSTTLEAKTTKLETTADTEVLESEELDEFEELEDIQCLDDCLIRAIDVETEIKALPKNILDEISYQKKKYPGMSVAVGIYSLDGAQGYEYNAEALISGGCTVKAAYAMYVTQKCKEDGIDIETETLTYKKGMRNSGSGIIKNSKYGTKYTIEYLLEKLLDISDNTAYNILLSRFPLKEFQEFLDDIGGQNLYGRQYGDASVRQRKNEWLTIYEYINSDAEYAKTLRKDITNTKYCYAVDWMKGEHTYMHKSGWCNDKKYTCACDCVIVDENYLLIVFTQDYTTGVAHTDSVRSIGVRVEEFANSLGGEIF